MKGHPKIGHPSKSPFWWHLFISDIYTEGAFVFSVKSKESPNRLEMVCYKKQKIHQEKHSRPRQGSKVSKQLPLIPYSVLM